MAVYYYGAIKLIPTFNLYYEGQKNLALRKPTWQSSTWSHGLYTSDKAVDGNKNVNMQNMGCSHTKEEYNPWWVVSLEADYFVTKVLITNRNQWGRYGVQWGKGAVTR